MIRCSPPSSDINFTVQCSTWCMCVLCRWFFSPSCCCARVHNTCLYSFSVGFTSSCACSRFHVTHFLCRGRGPPYHCFHHHLVSSHSDSRHSISLLCSTVRAWRLVHRSETKYIILLLINYCSLYSIWWVRAKEEMLPSMSCSTIFTSPYTQMSSLWMKIAEISSSSSSSSGYGVYFICQMCEVPKCSTPTFTIDISLCRNNMTRCGMHKTTLSR